MRAIWIFAGKCYLLSWILSFPLPLYFHSWIFSLSSKNKKKKILHNLISPTRRWTTSSTPLMSNQSFEILIWEWNNFENKKEKKKKETYIIRKFESIAFTPSPREENFGQTRCYARQRGDGYFLWSTRGREGGKEAKGGKEMADERLFSFSRSSASVHHATKPRFDPPLS